MIQQRVIITNSEYDIQSFLDKGWRVISVIAQHVSGRDSHGKEGKFCFILERNIADEKTN